MGTLIFSWIAFFLLSCHSLVAPTSSSSPHPLTLAWEQALQEGTLLLSRLSALRTRVQSRLSLEEAIEHTERVHRGSLKLTPLPTAVPRVFESGDGHVSLDEYPHLPASVEAAHAREYQLQSQRVWEAQAKARGQGGVSPQALPPVPPLTPPQRVAATLGVMVARVRALPLLRLHGVGVTEDFDGRIAFWANNVTLEQLFATAPGWPYALSGGNQGAGFEGKGGEGGGPWAGKPTPTPLPTPSPFLPAHLHQGASSLLGLAYRSSNVAAAAAAVAAAAAAPAAAPVPPSGNPPSYISLDYNLYTGGAPRAKSLLDGIPLLRDLPTTTARRSGGGRGGAVPPLPRTLPQGSPPLGSDFSSAATGDEGFVVDPEGPTLPLSRRAPQNPHATHRYGLLTPIAIAFTPAEARVAALVRVLQGVGLVVAPVRGVYEGVRWVVGGLISGGGGVPPGWGRVTWWWWGAMGRTLAGGVWRVVVALVGEARAGALESAVDEVGFTVRWRVRGAWEGAAWAGGVVWGTGRELASMVFPEQDTAYRRAEVTALRMVLLHVEGMEREIKEHLREGQDALSDTAQKK